MYCDFKSRDCTTISERRDGVILDNSGGLLRCEGPAHQIIYVRVFTFISSAFGTVSRPNINNLSTNGEKLQNSPPQSDKIAWGGSVKSKNYQHCIFRCNFSSFSGQLSPFSGVGVGKGNYVLFPHFSRGFSVPEAFSFPLRGRMSLGSCVFSYLWLAVLGCHGYVCAQYIGDVSKCEKYLKVARLQSEFCTNYFFGATNFLTKNAPKCSPILLRFCFVGQKRSCQIPAKFPVKFPMRKFKKSPMSFCRSTGRKMSVGLYLPCHYEIIDDQVL